MGLVQRLLAEDAVTHHGDLYDLEGCILEPKPAGLPTFYMGGESPKAKDVICRLRDGLRHARRPARGHRREGQRHDRPGRRARQEFRFGVSGYVIVRDSEAEAQEELARILDVKSPEAYASYQDFLAGSQLESQVSLEEYSVGDRGLRAGLVGTPDQVTERIRAYEDAGVDLMLLQFSPQREEMARFGRDVIARYGAADGSDRRGQPTRWRPSASARWRGAGTSRASRPARRAARAALRRSARPGRGPCPGPRARGRPPSVRRRTAGGRRRAPAGRGRAARSSAPGGRRRGGRPAPRARPARLRVGRRP